MGAFDDLSSRVAAASTAMVDLRHDLHAHPELAFDEHRTTGVIVKRLTELGWRVDPCPTPTGAVAVLEGALPGRRVMIRADIDALPVTEERDVAFRSTVDGVMHACGHDVHTAALLGVADVLAGGRDRLAGTVTLVFQPAEETVGGASAMIDGGLLASHRADAVIGVHVTSLAPVGVIATRPGVFMSEADTFRIELRGTGGHGAMPTTMGNVVLAASALPGRAGEVVEGLDFEGATGACSINVVRVGTKNNVVPRTAVLEGTLRTFTPEHRAGALQRLSELIDGVALAYGVDGALTLTEHVVAVRNDPAVTARMLDVARRVVGDAGVMEVPPVAPSDDVAELLARVPGCYLFVGGALADGSSGMHHGPDFAIADDALAVIAELLSAGALDLATP